eukprot:SAG11_NODE_9191_length_934_cov_1.180838_1_plen_92_part_00
MIFVGADGAKNRLGDKLAVGARTIVSGLSDALICSSYTLQAASCKLQDASYTLQSVSVVGVNVSAHCANVSAHCARFGLVKVTILHQIKTF